MAGNRANARTVPQGRLQPIQCGFLYGAKVELKMKSRHVAGVV